MACCSFCDQISTVCCSLRCNSKTKQTSNNFNVGIKNKSAEGTTVQELNQVH